MLKRISITGPECTGKSWLAEKLAEHFQGSCVPEFSIDYLNNKAENYQFEDILNIAKGQYALEESMAKQEKQLLFCDTDFVVNSIWSKVVYGKTHDWIEQMVQENQYALYLLCAPDIPWQKGPFRENPDDRELIFKLYEKTLIEKQFNYRVIKGNGLERFKNAINFVNEIL